MKRHRWNWLLLGAAAPLLLLAYDRCLMIRWLGDDDMEVVFFITDAATGRVVPGACVEVESEGGCAEDDSQVFALGTGADGIASKMFRKCTSVGSRSGLRLTNTHVVYPPSWRFRVTAPGFNQAGWTNLLTSENIRRVQWDGAGQAKLTVQIALEREQR